MAVAVVVAEVMMAIAVAMARVMARVMAVTHLRLKKLAGVRRQLACFRFVPGLARSMFCILFCALFFVLFYVPLIQSASQPVIGLRFSSVCCPRW